MEFITFLRSRVRSNRIRGHPARKLRAFATAAYITGKLIKQKGDLHS
jgi:hypothetical protein